MDEVQAEAIIASVYKDPHGRPNYKNPKPNPDLDLSIVVPVYNYANLIKANIDSILNQKTRYTYELILVDDGSTDGAREIVQQYEDLENVKVILQENQGIAGARNTGINAASGRYLMFVDCDDTIHDDTVETLLDKAYACNSDIAMCAHNLSKERDGKIYSIIPNIYPDMYLLCYKNGDEIMNFPGLPWCKVYKRELWNGVRFFPGYWYEDTIIQFLIFMKCQKIDYVPKVCYEYRWYEKNFSHVQGNSQDIRCIDILWLLKAILERYNELRMPLNKAFYTLLLKHLSCYYYSKIAGLDNNLVDALFVVACNLLRQYKSDGDCALPYVLKVTEKAMLENNIELWKLASRFQ